MTKYLTIVLLAALIVVRLALALGYPNPLSDDEVAHYSYAAFVAQTYTLPMFAEPKMYTDQNFKGLYWFQNYQQPGFYLAAAPFAKIGPLAIRLFSLSFWIAGVVLIWSICRQWWLLVFLALPGSIIVSSMVTNQSLEFFGACLLAYGLHENSDLTVMGAAFVMCLARITGVAVCVGLMVWYLWKKHPRAFYLVPGIMVGLWAFVERAHLFAANSTAMQGFYENLRNAGHAVATGLIDPMQPSSEWMVLLGIAAVVGLAAFLLYRWRWFIESERGVVLGTCGAILLWFGMTHGFSEGRLLYAAVPLLVVGGKA